MIFILCPNDFWHKTKIYNFDPYNVFLVIAINIPQRLKTGFVLQGHIYAVQKMNCTADEKGFYSMVAHSSFPTYVTSVLDYVNKRVNQFLEPLHWNKLSERINLCSKKHIRFPCCLSLCITGNNVVNNVQFLAQTNRFASYDLNTSIHFVFPDMFFFDSQSDISHCLAITRFN